MPSIAIVGAGPAGLTLARLLQVKCKAASISDLDITIFEKDASADARFDQGGTLDLHTDTGIAALKAADMWDTILPRMRYEGEELVIADMNATKLVHIKSSKQVDPSNSAERPEIDREILKRYLLNAVLEIGGAQAVTWGKQLARADEASGKLQFKDGTEAGPFDLVIGADGAWSKIRNVVCPGVKPAYSGITGFEAFADEQHSGEHWSDIEKLVGGGSFFSYSQGRSVMGQRMEDRSMKISVWTRRDESWAADLVQSSDGDDDQIRQTLLDEVHAWDDKIKLLIKVGYRFRPWPLYELPVGHSWEHRKGFTLIGDSAHLMTPFAGEGVNAAMKDALDLSERIIPSLKDGNLSLDDAVQRFEQDMFPRNVTVQGETARNKNGFFFKPDAPVEFLAGAADMFAQEAGYDTSRGLLYWAVVPVRAALYMYFWLVSRFGRLQRRWRGSSMIH